MSAKNGDKSRHHRQRKQKLRRRVRDKALLASAKSQPEAKSSAAARNQ